MSAHRELTTEDDLEALPDGAVILGGKIPANRIPWKAWRTSEAYGARRLWRGAANENVVDHPSSAFGFPALLLFDPSE